MLVLLFILGSRILFGILGMIVVRLLIVCGVFSGFIWIYSFWWLCEGCVVRNLCISLCVCCLLVFVIEFLRLRISVFVGLVVFFFIFFLLLFGVNRRECIMYYFVWVGLIGGIGWWFFFVDWSSDVWRWWCFVWVLICFFWC